MLNRMADTYQRNAGGAISWDSIILTGGGIPLTTSPRPRLTTSR
jgi:hypothetical protein